MSLMAAAKRLPLGMISYGPLVEDVCRRLVWARWGGMHGHNEMKGFMEAGTTHRGLVLPSGVYVLTARSVQSGPSDGDQHGV